MDANETLQAGGTLPPATIYPNNIAPPENSTATSNSSSIPVPVPSSTAAATQQFCLRWNSYPATVATQLTALRASEDFVDVTLACEKMFIRAHKLVLSACSPYFMQLFKSTPCKHPVIFLHDVKYRQLAALIEFMYAGEVNVSQMELPALLRTAEALQVRGLADTTTNNNIPAQQPPKSPFSPSCAPPVSQPVMSTLPPPTMTTSESLNMPSTSEAQSLTNVPSSSANLTTNNNNVNAKRSRLDRPSVESSRNNTAGIEYEDNSSESNESPDFDANMAEQDFKNFIEDATGDLGNSGMYSGEEGMDGSFTMNQVDMSGTGKSEDDTSEDEDDDDTGEVKDFAYHSDASFGGDPLLECGGNSNGNGENNVPSTSSATGPLPSSILSDGDMKEALAKLPNPGGSGGGRGRLSRALWPPGIPYHGPQQCPYCPRVLSNVGNWRKHVLTMHFAREKVYKCRHCASSFRTAEYLQKHYVRVHNYPQKITRKKFPEPTAPV